MIRHELTINNRLGLHARAAARFVAVASEFQCEIHVCHGDKRVNGKSVMELMMLAASAEATITVEAEGEDAEQALEALTDLVGAGFGEEASEE